MRTSRKAVVMAGVVALLAGSFGISGAGAASASEGSASSPIDSVSLTGYPEPVQDEIDRLLSEGAEILAVETADFVPTVDLGEVAPMAFPNGCGLTVVISKNNLVIHGGSVTACWTGPYTSLSMSSTMTHFNPDLGIWDGTVAYGSQNYGPGTSAVLGLDYNCNNTLRSNYRVATSGVMWRGGAQSTAGVYDTLDSNVLCGT